MKTEPVIEKARDAEVLLIAIDCSRSFAESSEQFHNLRHVAAEMAKKRLLFGHRNDILSVFKLGSNLTNNNLAEIQEGGYRNIELIFPGARSSVETIKCIQEINPVSVDFIGMDCLEVFGDYLLSFESTAAKTRRACLFVHSKFISVKPSDEELSELITTCDLYRKENIRIDIVCADWLDQYDVDDDDDDPELKELTPALCFERAAKLGIPAVWALARATGGIFVGIQDAAEQMAEPEPRIKRPFVRYRGTLDIGSIVQIPVKVYYSVSETRKEGATKLSWAASQSEGKQVGVLVESQLVVSATDPVALEKDQLIPAYKYGTDLVPIKNQDSDDAWFCNMERSLSTIAFISLETVPVQWLMSPVSVVIPMNGVTEAYAAISALVQALHEDGKGILARYVQNKNGGAPVMVFLWPAIEIDRDSARVKNRFLYCSELPLREDLRDYPFSNLKKVREKLTLEAESAMDDFIDSRMLSGSTKKTETEKDDEMAVDEEPELVVTEICNPALDRFYASVVQRALDGVSGTGLPPLSKWQKKLFEPSSSFVTEEHREAIEKSVQRLKVALAVSKVPPKEREKKVIEALSGESISISDFLPPESEENGGLDDSADPAYLGAAVDW